MKAKIFALDINPLRCCAKTENEILIVFQPPQTARLDLEDTLDFDLRTLDLPQKVKNLTKSEAFDVTVKKRDVHDLRLGPADGVNHFPSRKRRNGG